MANVNTLEDIFKMVQPADMQGAIKLSAGTGDVSAIKEIIELVYGTNGILPTDTLIEKLDTLASKNDDNTRFINEHVQVYSSSDKHLSSKSAQSGIQNAAIDAFGKMKDDVSFKEIIQNIDLPTDTRMGVILSNTGFITPAARNGEKVELFLNYLPSLFASQLVPYLDIEFSFSRDQNQQQRVGLMKFLLGENVDNVTESPTVLMMNARDQAEGKTIRSSAGMEMFTSPQTLLPLGQQMGNRYSPILDQTRPYMSIESLNISVTPSVGMFTYKKATLTLKLHDRSRLADIADLIRPQVFQDVASAPILWLTYGWRYPMISAEKRSNGSSTYAEFINSNMLVREAYKIINSTFTFDQVGQVTITLELGTHGGYDLMTLSVNKGERLAEVKRLEGIIRKIGELRKQLRLDPPEGVNKELRTFVLLDAAESGTLPDLSVKEVSAALKKLAETLRQGAVDTSATNTLINQLEDYYRTNGTNSKFYQQDELESESRSLARSFLTKVSQGVDPFLPTANTSPNTGNKKQQQAKQGKQKENRIALEKLVDAINAYNEEPPPQPVQKGKPIPFTKKLVSFGKIVTTFLAYAYKSIVDIDEMQVLFYQFNDRAGALGGENIASFPVDMSVFLEFYAEHVKSRGTTEMTFNDLFRLIVDSQVNDIRSVGYGFRHFYNKFDPATKADPTFVKGSEQEAENALAGVGRKRGPFNKPVLEMYIETTYSTSETSTTDLLLQYEAFATAGRRRASNVSAQQKIMRVHVFDKTNGPYKPQGKLLQGDNSDPAFYEVEDQSAGQKYSDYAALLERITPGSVNSDLTVKRTNGRADYDSIKRFISKTIPTIVYGANGSTVTQATLTSKQDPLLNAAQQIKLAGNSRVGNSVAASSTKGLPLRMIPATLSMTTLGCPLLTLAQQFFVDFNTGTTLDNIYIMTSLNHTIAPGKFESAMNFSFVDAYGKFETASLKDNVITELKAAQEAADKAEAEANRKKPG